MTKCSARTLIILIALLVIASPVIYWQRWAIPGITFIYTMGSMGCLLLALLLATFLPWQKRGLIIAGRILRWGYLAATVCFIVSFIVVQNAIWRTVGQAGNRPPTAQCLLVLGAGIRGETPSLTLQNRLLAARDYLQANPQAVAVLTGGQGPGEDITEALAMQHWLIDNGIEEGRLYLEEQATSTGENIAFSKPIIEHLGYDTVVLITNDFHLLRSSWLAAHYGLNTQLLGTPTPRYFLIPAASCSREYFALVKDWLLLNFYPNRLPTVS